MSVVIVMVGCCESGGGLGVIGSSMVFFILRFGIFYSGRKNSDELDLSSLFDLIKFYVELFDYFVE